MAIACTAARSLRVFNSSWRASPSVNPLRLSCYAGASRSCKLQCDNPGKTRIRKAVCKIRCTVRHNVVSASAKAVQQALYSTTGQKRRADGDRRSSRLFRKKHLVAICRAGWIRAPTSGVDAVWILTVGPMSQPSCQRRSQNCATRPGFILSAPPICRRFPDLLFFEKTWLGATADRRCAPPHENQQASRASRDVARGGVERSCRITAHSVANPSSA